MLRTERRPRSLYRSRRALATMALAMLLLVAWPLAAEDPPVVEDPASAHENTEDASPLATWDDLGPWERTFVREQLRALGRVAHPTPADGLRICSVLTRRLPIFGADDPWPDGLNRLHSLTRERTVRRRLTLREGGTYSELARRDAQRNLAGGLALATARVVPLLGAEPDCLDVLVVTRDAWSLRPTFFWSYAGALESLQLGLTETNLAGTHQSLGTSFRLGLGSWSLAVGWSTARIGATPLAAAATASVSFDRERQSRFEGTAHSASIGLPLRTAADRWGWSVATSHHDRVERVYVGSLLARWDDDATPAHDEVPWRWRQTDLGASASLTGSWGRAWKHDLLVGGGGSTTRITAQPREPLDPAAIEAFVREALPRGETVVGPTLGYSLYESRFTSVVDYQTYRVAEEVRLGLGANVSASWSEPGLGSSTRFVRPALGAGWVGRLGSSGLWIARVDETLRLELDGTGLSDATTAAAVRVVSPRLGGGRFLARVGASYRSRNGGNARSALGADAGLRGYVAGSLQGEHAARANVEWRSPSVRVLSTFVGMVVFADAGAAWDGAEPAIVYPSVGLGVRWMIPQLDTVVRSLDVGFPLRDFRPIRIRGTSIGLPIPVVSITLGQPI